MTSLVSAETLKLRTTRSWIGIVVALLAIAGIGAAGTVGSASDADLGSTELSREALSAALFGAFLAFLLGITMVTAEWRHGTITRTFLAEPVRARVLVAKEVVGALAGIVLALIAVATVVLVATIWLAVESASLGVDGDTVGLGARIVLAAALWGALGVGFGATVQSQTAALVIAILWVLVGESLIAALLGLADLEGAADFFPGRSLDALGGSSEGGLEWWAGALVGAGWVVALGVLGAVRMNRRDVA